MSEFQCCKCREWAILKNGLCPTCRIPQFKGESAYHAFVEYNALDIEAEREFLEWCESTGLPDVRQLTNLDLIQEGYEEYQTQP